MEQVHAGDLLEQFAGEMLGGGKAGAGKDDLARIGFGGVDQLFHSVGGKSGRVTIKRLALATCATGVNAAVS